MGARFSGVDEQVMVAGCVVRRATGADAWAYAQADAEMMAATYTYTMPPEFARTRLAEVPAVAADLAEAFDRALAAERRGEEPERRTWVAIDGDRIVGIAVSTAFRQWWEEERSDIVPVPGVTYLLNHLYLRPDTHGTGLGQAMLDLALPDRLAAYLWLIGGNDRARRFYERNGFADEGIRYTTGPVWYDQPMFRLIRR